MVMAATLDTMPDPLPENSSDEHQYIELDSSPVKANAQAINIDQKDTPKKPQLITPAKEVVNNENDNSNTSTPTKTPKQKQREEERIAKLKQKELEKQEREKAKEAEKQLKEQKRLEKELERKKANEEKERIKKEKRDQLQREKEEKERQRLKEKEEKEKQRLKEKEEKEKQRLEEKQKKEEERLKKEEEKIKAEEEKKKAEEEKQKKKQKLHISNFFKPKSVVKSSTITDETTEESSNVDYTRSFHDFYLREHVHLISPPKKSDIENFDKQLQSSRPNDLKNWFQDQNSNDNDKPQHYTTAKYVFEIQLDSAPLSFKYIRFYENIRTYIGTYSKEPISGIGMNPFIQVETPFIDWDDEQEEDDEGEGEDIDEEDEDEDEEDDEGSEEDLSDFLEDDKSTNTKRKALGPLVPIVHWHKTSEINLTVEILKENVTSIDPYHNYWEVVTTNTDGESISEEPKPKKTKTLILERNDLEIFAKEVHNTDFTVPTMVELLKKKLPNYTKLTIENTLKAYAKKVGQKATEKKWEIDTEQLKKAMGVW